jgi:hypothetical protein
MPARKPKRTRSIGSDNRRETSNFPVIPRSGRPAARPRRGAKSQKSTSRPTSSWPDLTTGLGTRAEDLALGRPLRLHAINSDPKILDNRILYLGNSHFVDERFVDFDAETWSLWRFHAAVHQWEHIGNQFMLHWIVGQ